MTPFIRNRLRAESSAIDHLVAALGRQGLEWERLEYLRRAYLQDLKSASKRLKRQAAKEEAPALKEVA